MSGVAGLYKVDWHVPDRIASSSAQHLVTLPDGWRPEDVPTELVRQVYGPENDSAKYIIVDRIELLP